MKKIATALVASLAGGPVGHAQPRPPKPSIHKQAEAARKACAPYAGHIEAAERANKLRRHTLTALLYSESKCKPTAEHKRSRARGVGQFTPSGAAAVGRIQRARGEASWFTYAKTLDPVESIRAAAELVAFSLELSGSLTEAIGAYNTGRLVSNRFSRAVLRLAAALRSMTGEEAAT